MVNNKILSSYKDNPPQKESSKRIKIMGGPLYDCNQVLDILSQGESVVRPWTKKCISDLKKWNLDQYDVMELLKLALSTGTFKGSEWCINKPGGAWAACDSYQVYRHERIEKTDKCMTVEYYIKFAIGSLNNLILTISCHP